MVDKTYEFCGNFIVTAVRHGMVTQKDGERIAEYAMRREIDQATAAVDLALLAPQHVSAILALEQRSDFVPGYTLLGLLGFGAAGIVFRARQDALDRDVALKTIALNRDSSATAEKRIEREARAIAKLHHPNVVTAYDSAVRDGRMYIAMELVEGEDLSTYLKRLGPVPPCLAWGIARQVAAALAHADTNGIIHRDIKPGNVLLTEPPSGSDLPSGVPLAKVADFGLAYQAARTGPSELTATGATLGTPAYVAPEQLQDTQVDARADIYALGATVFHMLAGHPPYHDRSPMQAIIAKVSNDDGWRAELANVGDDASAEVIAAMTETDPDDRIRDYEDLIGRIDSTLAGLLGSTTTCSSYVPKTVSEKPRAMSRSNRWWLLAGVAATLLIIAVSTSIYTLYWWLRSSPEAIEREGAWIVSEVPQPLFNGLSVPLTPQSGKWQPRTASDGSRVLVGSSNAQMTILLTDTSLSSAKASWRFRVSVQPQDSATAVIELPDIRANSTSSDTIGLAINREMVRLTGGGGTTTSSVALRAADDEGPTFQEVQIARQAETLQLSVNGKLIDKTNIGHSGPTGIVLRAFGGEVYFADLDIVEMHLKSSQVNLSE